MSSNISNPSGGTSGGSVVLPVSDVNASSLLLSSAKATPQGMQLLSSQHPNVASSTSKKSSGPTEEGKPTTKTTTTTTASGSGSVFLPQFAIPKRLFLSSPPQSSPVVSRKPKTKGGSKGLNETEETGPASTQESRTAEVLRPMTLLQSSTTATCFPPDDDNLCPDDQYAEIVVPALYDQLMARKALRLMFRFRKGDPIMTTAGAPLPPRKLGSNASLSLQRSGSMSPPSMAAQGEGASSVSSFGELDSSSTYHHSPESTNSPTSTAVKGGTQVSVPPSRGQSPLSCLSQGSCSTTTTTTGGLLARTECMGLVVDGKRFLRLQLPNPPGDAEEEVQQLELYLSGLEEVFSLYSVEHSAGTPTTVPAHQSPSPTTTHRLCLSSRPCRIPGLRFAPTSKKPPMEEAIQEEKEKDEKEEEAAAPLKTKKPRRRRQGPTPGFEGKLRLYVRTFQPGSRVELLESTFINAPAK